VSEDWCKKAQFADWCRGCPKNKGLVRSIFQEATEKEKAETK